MLCRGFKILVASVLLWAIPIFANAAELDVSELIAGLKRAIIESQKTAEPPYINMTWVEGEISYVVKKEGEAGFKLFVVTAEGKYATEAVQRVKFRLEPPSGKPWRVEGPGELKNAFISGVDLATGKVFVSTSEEIGIVTFPVEVKADTKITDFAGKTKTLFDIKAGMQGTIRYSPGPLGEPKATAIIIAPPKEPRQ